MWRFLFGVLCGYVLAQALREPEQTRAPAPPPPPPASEDTGLEQELTEALTPEADAPPATEPPQARPPAEEAVEATDPDPDPKLDYMSALRLEIVKAEEPAEKIARRLAETYSLDYGTVLNDAYNLESQLRG